MDPARIQRLQEQKRDLEEKVGRNPEVRPYWVQLGNICRQLGDNETAIKALRMALELKSDDSFTSNLLAQLEGRSPMGHGQPPMQPIRLTPIQSEPQNPMPAKYIAPIVVVALLLLAGIGYKIYTGIQSYGVKQVNLPSNNLFYPRISPNGEWIVFAAGPPDDHPLDNRSIYSATPDLKTMLPLITESDDFRLTVTTATWLPDSSGFIIQGVDKKSTDGAGNQAFYIVKPDGSGKTPIFIEPPAPMDDEPAISPDGSRIAYTARFPDDDKLSLMIADIVTGKTIKVASYQDISEIKFSHDSTYVAFCANYYDPEKNEVRYFLLTVTSDGAVPRDVDETGSGCSPAFWGTEQVKLVYFKKDLLYYVSADTLTDPTPLLPEKFRGRVLGETTVSTDRKVLAFSAVVGMVQSPMGNIPMSDVFLLVDGQSEPVLSIEKYQGKFSPSLSPDGKWIAFGKMAMNPLTPMQICIGNTVLK